MRSPGLTALGYLASDCEFSSCVVYRDCDMARGHVCVP